jgi:hypothetical protein
MIMPKEVLLTVHGIRTKGSWQEEIEPLISPFFDHFPFKYSDFSGPISGPLWLCLEPLGLMLGLALSLLFFFGLGWRGPTKLTIIGSILLCVWLASRILAGRRRERILRAFKLHWDKTVGAGRPPYIIAHSFGTYLVGAALDRFSDLRVERLILTGCVLKSHFPWASLQGVRHSRRFKSVHNEMAKKDLVAVLAKLLEGFVPPMGHAGVFGFNDPDICLAWDDPWKVGEQWSFDPGSEHALGQKSFVVHNVAHRGLSHSDYFIGLSHARTFWLPFFWEIPVGLFEQFKDLCIQCRELEMAGRYHDLIAKEALLTTSSWGWTQGSLRQCVTKSAAEYLKHLNKAPSHIEEIVALSIRNMWHLVWQATNHSTQVLFAEYLYPYRALVQCIETAVEQVQLHRAGQVMRTASRIDLAMSAERAVTSKPISLYQT